MDKARIEKIVEEIALPISEGFGCELVDVEFKREGGAWYLRVYIDKENGVNLDDCANVSRKLSDKLDELDPISYSYYLEVSSPGLDRPLKKDRDFELFKGSNIKIKLFKPLGDKKIYEGILVDFVDGYVVIDVNGEEIKIERSLAASIRLNE